MEKIDIHQFLSSTVGLVGSSVVLGGVLLLLFVIVRKGTQKKKGKPSLPCIPGRVPLIGNLLQLKDKKPHKTFIKWAEVHGPIYSVKTGASSMVVLNSTPLVKEAMVTRYSSISTRKLSKALNILTSDKCLVAMSDYNEFHKRIKRYIITGLLGANAQKQYRCHRDTMMDNMLKQLHTYMETNPLSAVNLRRTFESELFALALKQALGKDLEASVYVEELGTSLSKHEIYEVLVIDPMMGAIDVDWRDFFPYLRWVPNRSLEMKIQRMSIRRRAVMKVLIEQQKKRISSGEKLSCYLDFLLSEAQQTLTEEQLSMLIWETIIEASDTTLVVTEWAMYEIAKNTSCQDRLYTEIQEVCGSNKITEEHLARMPYLNAVFHETLRKHSPVPIIPLRYAHEDTELGSYHVPAGSEIAINIYGCNMDTKQWGDPETWKPERFLDSKYDQMDLYKTMAFGGGKRVCAGSLQASTIAFMAIGRFVQEFEWRLTKGEEEDVNTVGLTSHKLHPLHAIITPRARP